MICRKYFFYPSWALGLFFWSSSFMKKHSKTHHPQKIPSTSEKRLKLNSACLSNRNIGTRACSRNNHNIHQFQQAGLSVHPTTRNHDEYPAEPAANAPPRWPTPLCDARWCAHALTSFRASASQLEVAPPSQRQMASGGRSLCPAHHPRLQARLSQTSPSLIGDPPRVPLRGAALRTYAHHEEV